MPINLTKAFTAVGVGVIDDVLERNDNKEGRTGIQKRWSDWARIGLVVGGYGVTYFMPRYADIGETVALASTPLLVKTIAREVMSDDGGKKKDFTRRSVAGPSMRNWAPTARFSGGAYRSISVTR